MLDKVFEIVRQKGPVLPVEIATKLGVDSFIANAYLSQLSEAGKIKIGTERVGNSFLYFMPGQENAANLRTKTLLQQGKKTAKTFQKETAPVSPGVAEKRDAFAKRLKEIEEREEKEKRKVEVKAPMSEREDFLERVKQAITPFLTPKQEEPQPEIKIKSEIEVIEPEPELIKEDAPKEVPKDVPKEKAKVSPEPKKRAPKKKTLFGPKVDVIELAMEYLVERGAEIIAKDAKKKKEVDLLVKIPSGIGPVKMFVKVKDKKSINEADLSLTYTQGQNKKLPVLLLTTGKLTKTAQNYLKVIEGLLKVKFLEPKAK